MSHQHLHPLRSHRVKGGGGAELYVEEAGNRSGRSVLFIHGFSQSRLAWHAQLHSSLAQDLRLVAMDLRGHGWSEGPRDAYGESLVWADDIHEVITALELDRPILCGWSYGGVVIGDYVRTYGEHLIGGINLVAAVARLGETVLPYMGQGFLDVLPGLFSDDVDTSTRALQDFIRICTHAEPAPEDFYRVIGYNSIVAPHVRQGLMSRSLEHDDVLVGLTTPVMITHGLEDKVVLPAMSEYHAGIIPNAIASYYPNIGHSPFMEDADRFNDELRAFAMAR